MTKNILLAAASVVALGFAGAASAADLSVSIASEAVTSTDRYTIASEVEGDLTGEIVATVSYDDELPQADNLKLTFTLGGGATFADSVTSAQLAGFDEVIISEGGAEGSSSVTFLVSNPSIDGADTVATFTGDITFEAGDLATLRVRTTTENNTPIEGGFAPMGGALQLVDYDSFLVADADADATDPYYATIESGFEVFSNGDTPTTATLGTIEIDFAEDVFINLDGETADEDQFEEAVITINGSRTNLDYTVAGADVSGNQITISTPGTYTVVASIDDGPINTSDYSAMADITFSGDYDDVNDRALGSLSDIRREGTSVIVPWVASNSLGALNNTRNVLRISNTSSERTGRVYFEVVASGAAQGVNPSFNDGLVETTLTVPANGDLQITSAQMESILGGDFRRADIRVTVEAAAEDLIFRSRIAQANGTVEEIELEPEVGPETPAT